MAEDLTPLGSIDDAAAFGERGVPVELSGVSKSFDGLAAVDSIDLTIEAGELLVLLGPSGCGKTTTLRLIAGLEVVDSGTITIGDEDVTQSLPQQRDVSMVFQNYALYPHLSVRENLLFPLGKTDLSTAERSDRVETVATLLELEPHLEKAPDQLSGGQRQRVALGRTIVREPRVYLLDEPLSNLDANLRVQTRAEFATLQHRLGTTTVYVTHDQEEALSIADRIAIMNDGAIEQIGTPETVYTNPVNEFVATFLGDPSMNILEITGHDDQVSLADSLTLSGTDLTVPPAADRLGIRPEDVYLDDTDTRHESVAELSDSMEMTVDVVEPLGPEYQLTLHRGQTRITVRTTTTTATTGDSVSIRFDTNRLHYFDETGGPL